MPDKYQNKYRIKSARLPTWDYRNMCAYFITICTANRRHYFGEIERGVMCINEIGAIAWDEWFKTPIIRPDMNLGLGEFVLMPNHVHAIVVIGENRYNDRSSVNKFGPQSKNMASIIRGFKSAVTKRGRAINPEFGWQPRFYDNVIRNENAYLNISNYIFNNPSKWAQDKFGNLES